MSRFLKMLFGAAASILGTTFIMAISSSPFPPRPEAYSPPGFAMVAATVLALMTIIAGAWLAWIGVNGGRGVIKAEHDLRRAREKAA